ncbi:MAG: sensor histidine kinase [Azoarcus sp.]|nr:sensor histidine kinase [Azoarcus sp.]
MSADESPPTMKPATRRAGLTARLLWLGLGPALLLVLLLGGLLYKDIHDSLYGGFVRLLDGQADHLEARLEVGPDGLWRYAPGRGNDEFSQIFSGWYWVVVGQGQTLYSRSLWDGALQAEPARDARALLRDTDPRGRPLLGIERDIRIGDVPARLRVYGPASGVTDDLERIGRTLWLGLACLLVGVVVTVVVQVRVGLRPVERLKQRLEKLHSQPDAGGGDGGGEVADWLGTGYGPELDPLAGEIDALLLRNARMLARSRSHAADLSHALKTPLARLGLEAGRQPRMDSALVIEQVRSINGLIERHLARAAPPAEAAAPRRDAVSVRETAERLVALIRHSRPEKRLSWQMDIPDELAWLGDASDLEEMLGNLLDNAGKWAAAKVRVSARHAPEAARGNARASLFIDIADDGPGLPPERLEEALRRGRRFDESTPGSGLGLSIAADIAHTWGGDLQLRASAELGGLAARLRLPA